MSRSVWFIAEHEDGVLNRGAAELAGAARGLDAEAVAVVCAAPGSDVAAQVAPLADRVISFSSPELAGYSADAWGQAIVQLARERSPAAILLPHAPLGRDLGPVLAARLASGMLSDTTSLT